MANWSAFPTLLDGAREIFEPDTVAEHRPRSASIHSPDDLRFMRNRPEVAQTIQPDWGTQAGRNYDLIRTRMQEDLIRSRAAMITVASKDAVRAISDAFLEKLSEAFSDVTVNNHSLVTLLSSTGVVKNVDFMTIIRYRLLPEGITDERVLDYLNLCRVTVRSMVTTIVTDVMWVQQVAEIASGEGTTYGVDHYTRQNLEKVVVMFNNMLSFITSSTSDEIVNAVRNMRCGIFGAVVTVIATTTCRAMRRIFFMNMMNKASTVATLMPFLSVVPNILMYHKWVLVTYATTVSIMLVARLICDFLRHKDEREVARAITLFEFDAANIMGIWPSMSTNGIRILLTMKKGRNAALLTENATSNKCVAISSLTKVVVAMVVTVKDRDMEPSIKAGRLTEIYYVTNSRETQVLTVIAMVLSTVTCVYSEMTDMPHDIKGIILVIISELAGERSWSGIQWLISSGRSFGRDIVANVVTRVIGVLMLYARLNSKRRLLKNLTYCYQLGFANLLAIGLWRRGRVNLDRKLDYHAIIKEYGSIDVVYKYKGLPYTRCADINNDALSLYRPVLSATAKFGVRRGTAHDGEPIADMHEDWIASGCGAVPLKKQ